MATPDVRGRVLKNQLGLITTQNAVQVILATCSKGTSGQLYTFGNVDDLAQVGDGDMPQAAAFALSATGGPVLGVKLPSTTAGSFGAVTQSPTVGKGTIVPSGVPAVVGGAEIGPWMDARVRIKITVSGDTGTAKFVYSINRGELDSNGDDATTYSQEIITAGTYDLPGTGIRLTFTNVAPTPAFVKDEMYDFDVTGPAYSSSDLSTGMDALLTNRRTWRLVNILGPADPTKVGVVQTKMNAAYVNDYRYARAMMHTRDQNAGETVSTWVNALISQFGNVVADRVSLCAGHASTLAPTVQIVSGLINKPTVGVYMRRPLSWIAGARAAKVPVSQSLGEVEAGSLEGVQYIYQNDDIIQQLDDYRFTSGRSIKNYAGWYITRGHLLDQVGGDFTFWQFGAVMDVACTVLRAALVPKIEKKLRVNPTGSPYGRPGTIDGRDANSLESLAKSALAVALISDKEEFNHVSAINVKVNRTNDVIRTGRIEFEVSLTPLAYAGDIRFNIGFKNPYLVVK